MALIPTQPAPEPPRTGPRAIQARLQQLTPEKLQALREQALETIRSGAKSKRAAAVKTLHILQGLERNQLTPEDLVITKVPVIPTRFRPFSVVGGETFVPGDANELYRDLVDLRNAWSRQKELLGDQAALTRTPVLYDAVRALYGYGDPVIPKTKERGVQGFLKMVTGTGPKWSYFQRRLISKPVDTTGRGVITVDPELGIDEVAVPEEQAWDYYKDYVIRQLRRTGMSGGQALKLWKERAAPARKALEIVSTPGPNGRPILVSRAPAWHKFNTVAAWPKLTTGHAVRINPLITTGSNSDFDGDQQIAYVWALTEFGSCYQNQCYIKKLQKKLEEKALLVFRAGMTPPNGIPYYDTEKASLYLVDLADFPRGKLQRTIRGKNGPIDFYEVPVGLKVISHTDEGAAWADVAFFSVHHDREVEIVTLSDGQQILTDDDPRGVFGIPDKTTSLALERMTPSDALACRCMVPALRSIPSILPPAPHTAFGLRLPLDFDFGWSLGALCGDGWWSKKSYVSGGTKGRWDWQVHLSDLEGFNAARLGQFMRRANLGGVDCYIHDSSKEKYADRYGDTVRHTWQFKDPVEGEKLCTFLSAALGGSSGDNHTGSGSKHLPPWFLSAPEEFRAGLLTGLIDTDGTVSVSRGKSTPQLMIGFSSTSMRLARDFTLLAKSLGIGAKLHFAKKTIRGNVSWGVTVSTVDAKQKNFLQLLAHDTKRKNFIETAVASPEEAGTKFDYIPVPAVVRSAILTELGKPREPDAFATEETHKFQGVCATVIRKMAKGKPLLPRATARRMVAEIKCRYSKKVEFVEEQVRRLKRGVIDLKELNLALAVIHPPYADLPIKDDVRRLRVRVNGCAAGRLKVNADLVRALLKMLSENKPHTILHEAFFAQWLRILSDETIRWVVVVGVDKTGKKETGYDLTVPGTETFANEAGIILSNTMNIHVPATREAVREAVDVLMPSKMLFAIRDPERVMPLPKHEHILGLHNAQLRPAKNKVRFASEEEFDKAVQQGRVSMSDEVEIGGAGLPAPIA